MLDYTGWTCRSPVTCLSQAWGSLVLQGRAWETPFLQPQHQRERSDLKTRSFQEQHWLPWGSWSFSMSLSVSVSLHVYMSVRESVSVCVYSTCMHAKSSLLSVKENGSSVVQDGAKGRSIWWRLGSDMAGTHMEDCLHYEHPCGNFLLGHPILVYKVHETLNLPMAALTYLKVFCFQNSHWSC